MLLTLAWYKYTVKNIVYSYPFGWKIRLNSILKSRIFCAGIKFASCSDVPYLLCCVHLQLVLPSVCEICLFGLCQWALCLLWPSHHCALLLISLPMRTESVTRLDPHTADKQEKHSRPQWLSTRCWQCCK